MKINIGKLAGVAVQLAIALPNIIATVQPVIAAARKKAEPHSTSAPTI